MEMSAGGKEILEMIKNGEISPEEGLRMFRGPGNGVNGVPAAPAHRSERLYFRRRWEKSGTGSVYGNTDSTGEALIFDINGATLRYINDRLRDQGFNFRTVLVKPGKSFRSAGDQLYEIDIDSQDDYPRLFEELKRQGFLPGKIIYLWPWESPTGHDQDLKAQMDSGIYPLFNITRALVKQKTQKEITLLCIYPGGEDGPRPCHEAVSGFARSVMLENPRFQYKTVEIRNDSGSGNESDQDRLVNVMLRELQFEANGLEIRYQDGLRWVKRIEEFDLKGVPGEGGLLRERGVYLITGGAGDWERLLPNTWPGR